MLTKSSQLSQNTDEIAVSRVVVAEPTTRYSLDNAKEYGLVAYLTMDSYNPFAPTETMKKMRDALAEIEFVPSIDFICMTGYDLTKSLLLAVALNEYRRVKVLMFDAGNGRYKERVAEL